MEDDDDTLKGQFFNLLAIPAGMLLLVPLALLFVLWFYLASLAEGARLLAARPFSKRKTGVQIGGLHKLHFTEIRSQAPTEE